MSFEYYMLLSLKEKNEFRLSFSNKYIEFYHLKEFFFPWNEEGLRDRIKDLRERKRLEGIKK